MGALCARKDHIRIAWQRGSGWRQAYLDTLISGELHTGASMLSAAPISPVQRRGTHLEGMEQHAHLPRFVRLAPLPLALLAQRAGTTTVDAGCIHQAQTSIGFSALLMHHQRLMSRTL